VVPDRGRIPYGRRVRDGVPLPGRSPTEVLSQLAYRVFGPLHPDRVRVVLDYHGLDGQPAARLAEVAARQHVTSRTVSNHVAAVRAAGARLPLTDEVITAVTRGSIPGDDHRARVRIAGTLGLPAPAARQKPVTSSVSRVSPAQLRAARAAARVLAAVGPLPLDTLLAAVTRSRRFRTRSPLTAPGLGAGLTAVGATTDPADGLWRAPPGTTVPGRYRAVVDTAGGRDLTRQEMIAVLTAAGYSRTSADGRLSSSHPLFTRTGPGRYTLIGTHAPGSGPASS